MSRHRVTASDPFHLREARRPAHVTDENADQTARAYAAMTAGTYKGARSRESGGEYVADNLATVKEDRWRTGDGHKLSPTQVQKVRADLARSLVVPPAISVACPEGHAAEGEHCFGSVGVCWQRVVRVAALRAPGTGRVVGGGR